MHSVSRTWHSGKEYDTRVEVICVFGPTSEGNVVPWDWVAAAPFSSPSIPTSRFQGLGADHGPVIGTGLNTGALILL